MAVAPVGAEARLSGREPVASLARMSSYLIRKADFINLRVFVSEVETCDIAAGAEDLDFY